MGMLLLSGRFLALRAASVVKKVYTADVSLKLEEVVAELLKRPENETIVTYAEVI